MTKKLITATIALSMVALSSMAAAAEPASAELVSAQPIQLTASQMDDVSAGWSRFHLWNMPQLVSHWEVTNQINNSSVTILQIGNGNTAIVFSGNIYFH